MGAYKASEKDNASYVAMDLSEWNDYCKLQSEHKKLLANYKKLKKENKEQADLLETASRQYDKANDYIRKKKEQEQLIKQLQEECQVLREENKRLELTTKKMVRMQKERANQQRNLKPKKEHSGYVVLSQERIIREVVKGKSFYCIVLFFKLRTMLI